MKCVQQLILLLLLPVLSMAQAGKQGKTKPTGLLKNGDVHFQQYFNAADVSAEDLLRFGVKFMNEQDDPVFLYKLDRDQGTFTFHYEWPFTGLMFHCLDHSLICADITLFANGDTSKIVIADIRYSASDVCNNEGRIEELSRCNECNERQIREFEKWLSGRAESVMDQYIYFLRQWSEAGKDKR